MTDPIRPEDHRPGFQRLVRYIQGEPYWFARDSSNTPFSVLPQSFTTLIEIGTPGFPPHSTIMLPGTGDELTFEAFEAAVDAWIANADATAIGKVVWA